MIFYFKRVRTEILLRSCWLDFDELDRARRAMSIRSPDITDI